jgi:acetyl esterase/lipase
MTGSRKILTLLTPAILPLALLTTANLAGTVHALPAPEPITRDFLNVPYCIDSAHGAHLLDLRLPVTGKPPYPLIIYIHGGGWTSGDKSMFPTVLLHAHGYATASINYRLSPKDKFPAQIVDCKAAVGWLRSHASSLNLDPNRIGVWGASAGGHLAALLGTTGDARAPAWAAPSAGSSNRVDAVCDWCGPTDLITIVSQGGLKNRIIHAVSSLLGAHPWLRPDLAKEASPITYVHKGCPPFLIMHGDQDPLVPPGQSKQLTDALKAHGVDCSWQLIPGASHNFYSIENEKKVMQFFDRTLKNKR